jgi:hypothetical protein
MAFPILGVMGLYLMVGTGKLEEGVRQLFLDDHLIQQINGLRRVVNPPVRHPDNPVIRPDKPWENLCSVYGTALFDEELGRFRIWYLTTPRDRGLKPLLFPDGRERAPHTTLLAYAESTDGVHWVKPELNQFPYDGDTRNNLIDLGVYNCEGISVLYDPRDPDPQRRWKAVYWDHGSGGWTLRNGRPYCQEGPEDGFCVAFSPDGIRWRPYEGNPVLHRYCDTNQNLVYDPKLRRYVAFSRFGFGRRLARSESEDFLHWSDPEVVLECDERDGRGTQIYGAGVDIYEGVYIAMIWIYREGGDGKIDTQLATSRDGIHWIRVGDRATWLKLGEDDSWEGGMVRSVERIIVRGDRLYIYYGGVHGPHSRPGHPEVVRKHRAAIGLLTLRRDGFVSFDAGEEAGWLLTRPFVLPNGDLHLNVDARGGWIRVAVCDGTGSPIDGFETSEPVTGDMLDAVVRWEKGNLRRLEGRTVQLRFSLQRAKLYSFWFE